MKDAADGQGRIAPLAVLPLFWALGGRRVLVAGGCEAAAWKAELLAAAGARVLVVAAAPGDAMQALAARLPEQVAVLSGRRWAPEHFQGAVLAVGALAEPEEAEAFRTAARAAGIPVNLVDRPGLCDFSFGGIVNRSPLVIGIATDGAAPAFGQQVRARIEALLPPAIGAWVAAAKSWRPHITARGLPAEARRRLWARFAAMAMAGGGGPPPDPRRLDRLLATETPARPAGGSVILAGAGPGEPDLLTLGAVRALLTAAVVVHDGRRLSACVDIARREARRIDIGGKDAAEVAALLSGLARSGEEAVLLVHGDARTNLLAVAVAARLEAASIPSQVIAGIAEAGWLQKPGIKARTTAGAARFGPPAGLAAAPFP